MGGDLFTLLSRKKHLSESQTKFIGYQLMLALEYLHDQDISHRDLKPENILLANGDEDYTRVCLTDFGVAKFTGNRVTRLKTYCGRTRRRGEGGGCPARHTTVC